MQRNSLSVDDSIYIYIYIYMVVEGDPKAPFSIATRPMTEFELAR